jgi:hypothetical protein
MDHTKYLLCIPAGGINDMMTQIQLCLKYCIASGRMCVIDTGRVFEFENNIFDFFDISHSHIAKAPPAEFYKYVSETACLTIYPDIVTPDIISSFEVMWNNAYRCRTFMDVPVKLDTGRENKEDIIIHYDGGGGDCAGWFLKTFPPKAILLDELRKRFSMLGSNYLAVHVRNTDYKSDVSGFLVENDSILREYPTVFLASDSHATISSLKTIYGDKIKTFSTLTVTTPGFPQHYSCKKTPAFVIDAFCDILLLALSEKYLYSSIQSGYSRNASILHNDPAFRAYYRALLSSA